MHNSNMFLASALAFVILIATMCLTSAAPFALNQNELVILHTNFPVTRHLNKRDLTAATLAETDDLLENPNEFADKDFDMELAEVNVFRPVFRYRASYARKGR